MADEKLNTGPEVQKTEEAPAPAVADPAHGEAAVPEHPPEQAGPAEPGDVVISAEQIDALMAEKRQAARAEGEEYVRASGAQVIKDKGATFFAVAMSVCHICKCIFSGAGTALTVSTMMHGEYGIDDVCLSVLTIVDRTGVRGKIMNALTEDEVAKLHNSANRLKEVISHIE